MKNHGKGSDDFIEEVRERRRQVMADYGNDLAKLLEVFRRRQVAEPERYADLRRRGAAPGHPSDDRRGR